MSSYYGMRVTEYTEGANYNPKKGSAKERDPEGVEQDTKQQDNKDDNKKDSTEENGTAINNKKESPGHKVLG